MISSVVWLLVVMLITLLVNDVTLLVLVVVLMFVFGYCCAVGFGCVAMFGFGFGVLCISLLWLVRLVCFWLVCGFPVWLMLVDCLCGWYAVNSVVLIYF